MPVYRGKKLKITYSIGKTGFDNLDGYRNNQEMAKVDFPVGFPSWRTYSSIKILSKWKGHWWVEIIHGESALGGIDFTIE